ncbi:RluA family pseudouridine synthase [Magnetospira sp. QH-2]|uniref:RluA family pseudouridine synthase n=1 Tax=Magnetospira sp. (strain QH-2) TaxID=1288970 RepID=UPI0003E814E0|nr:RluA family pseudouridine synthase [Magnetospira sp. QH-2]CCQ74573.1 Pseudouridine synthase, 23S RNA specific [Magnetospira sp. QH-2]
MTGVQHIPVPEDDDGMRLDRWFRRLFPQVNQGRLQKLLRSGQIRVDGGRVKAAHRLTSGQQVRVPPLGDPVAAQPKPYQPIDPRQADDLRQRILHQDDHLLVIDKPAGLAVQGGSGTTKHLDGMLDALKLGAKERPRLVHRLDKDTAGVLVLARSAKVARELTALFKSREARKLYWAVVVGIPSPDQGRIVAPLVKLPGKAGERVVVDEEQGKKAETEFRIVDRAGNKAAWLALEPLTGRTHQLRAHCLYLGKPILGDGKYGGPEAFLSGVPQAKKLHLLARAIRFPHPAGGMLEVTAPLPPHMAQTWEYLGFQANLKDPEAGFGEYE